MEDEIWLPIASFENFYHVSSMGRIKSLWTNKILKPQINSRGYHHCSLFDDSGKAKHVRVHRAVLMSFIPDNKGKIFVNHKNGIKTDNRLENLEWCTSKENSIHSVETGLQKLGSKRAFAKLNEEIALLIREERRLTKISIRNLAEKYCVSKSAIQFLLEGKTWKHVK